MVGKWYSYSETEKKHFPEGIRPLLELKAEWLDGLKKKVQVSLLQYTLPRMKRNSDQVNDKNIQILSYKEEILDWMATLCWTASAEHLEKLTKELGG